MGPKPCPTPTCTRYGREPLRVGPRRISIVIADLSYTWRRITILVVIRLRNCYGDRSESSKLRTSSAKNVT